MKRWVWVTGGPRDNRSPVACERRPLRLGTGGDSLGTAPGAAGSWGQPAEGPVGGGRCGLARAPRISAALSRGKRLPHPDLGRGQRGQHLLSRCCRSRAIEPGWRLRSHPRPQPHTGGPCLTGARQHPQASQPRPGRSPLPLCPHGHLVHGGFWVGRCPRPLQLSPWILGRAASTRCRPRDATLLLRLPSSAHAPSLRAAGLLPRGCECVGPPCM